MKPIRTREQLIEKAIQLAPTKACASALKRGEWCCAFDSPLRKEDGFGWLISVYGRDKIWKLEILADLENQKWVARYA